MPRKYDLTWLDGAEGRAGRWRKKYKGRVHYFSGGRGKTDRDAYEAAVKAWEKKKVEIDGQVPRPFQEQYEQAIARWEEVHAWSLKHGEQNMAEKAQKSLERLRRRLAAANLKPLDVGDTFEGMLGLPRLQMKEVFEQVAAAVFANERRESQPIRSGEIIVVPQEPEIDLEAEIWQDRLEVQRRAATPEDQTVGAYVDRFLAEKEQQMKAGNLSVGQVSGLRIHLHRFRDWLGATASVEDIDAKTIAAYHGELMKKIIAKEWGQKTASNYFSTVKSFVRWLWQSEAISSLPRNLDGKSSALQFGVAPPKVVTFTKREITTLLKAATDRTKLFVLLMLNCGMTQKDISDLQPSEVNWDEGRITRKRSKTKEFDNVPTVCYLLWPETKRLLLQERAVGSADRVLLNENGEPLWRERIGKNDKYSKNDNILNAFAQLTKAQGISKPLKLLKKTSASMLRNNSKYASLPQLFLGHAPTTMSDRHYTEAPQTLLDEALVWLGKEYGVIPAEGGEQPEATPPAVAGCKKGKAKGKRNGKSKRS